MKLLRRDFTKDAGGSVKLLPDEADDMWHVYNLIAPHDFVTAVTFRKVRLQQSSGGSESERVRVRLEVEVEKTEYDVDNGAAIVRVRGKNMTENEHVRLGAYHTLDIELQRQFVLTKVVWDAVAVELLRQACDPGANADIAAVVLQEGLANLCLLGGSVTTTKARVETAIPRKRGAAIAGYDKALSKFFENVLQAIIRHVDFNVVKCLILASPGFTKDQLFDFMMLEASRRDIRKLIENKAKIVRAHCSSGYKHSLKEVLSEPIVMAQIKDTRAAKEVKAMEDFYSMLTTDPSRAFYGPKHVEAAHDRAAIQTLLITDALFRNADVTTRRKYVDLAEAIKDMGGDVHIFSSMHPSGEQLEQLSGIAALLRFPLPDLEDMDF